MKRNKERTRSFFPFFSFEPLAYICLVRYHSYLNTAKKIVTSYTGAMPLSHFLKQFFAAEKRYGSKDRNQIAALCYNYYRLGKAAQNISIEERILIAIFLCEHSPSGFLAFHKPDWNEKIMLPIS